jgi:hypothetical protein
MKTTQPDTRHADSDQQAFQNAIIGEQVLHLLGRPADLYRLEVRALWADHYRVNVFIGADAASVRLAHSYFVVVADDGTIRTSTPRLTRQY